MNKELFYSELSKDLKKKFGTSVEKALPWQLHESLSALPYPGFPTDMQSQMGVILSIADGTSVINESIWDSRFQYTEELNKMGAKITAQGKSAFFEGVKELKGAPVYASDLRAGAALIVAGIVAKGTTDIYNLEYIDRGYENIEEKFRSLGAKIERVEEN